MKMFHDITSAITRVFGRPPSNPYLETDKDLEEARDRFYRASQRHSRTTTVAATALNNLVQSIQRQGRRG